LCSARIASTALPRSRLARTEERGTLIISPIERVGHTDTSPSRLTLAPEQLFELTGYKRGAEQARWLKENGFKFRLDRLGKPRVDRAHYEARMGSKPAFGEQSIGGSPTGLH